MKSISSSSRIFVAVPAIGTLGAIAWYAYWMWPQRLAIPGFVPVFLIFFGGLALPYLVTLGLLAVRGGRDGLRVAFGTSLVNAVWALPLGALLVLFGGFTMGNRDQEQSLLAVATGALLQIPLLIISGSALWRSRKGEPASRALPLPAPIAWLLAFLLPIVASGGSFLYIDRQFKAFKVRSTQAAQNSRSAQEATKRLQDCLSNYRDAGYPPRLEVCKEVAAQMTESSGYRFEYLPALPDNGGRINAYQLCAQPLSFRATGFETIVVDSTGNYGAGVMRVMAEATLDNIPTCASSLGTERVISWCAYAFAAKEPSRGYPKRLAEIADCVTEKRKLINIDADRLKDDKAIYAYLANPPDEKGRATRFRIYRLGGADDSSLWIDDQLIPSRKKHPRIGPAVEGLPDLADPDRFTPGCNEGRGDDCFLAGYEWQRKAVQTAGGGKESAITAMHQSAFKAFERGCGLNEARSCAQLAQFELDRKPGRDVVRAAKLYEKACSLGNALGCRNAGEMYEKGSKAHIATLQSPSPPSPSKPDLDRDMARAIAFFGRACELDERDACFIAGRLLAAGEGIAPDNERAVAFFAQACEEGMALACSRAASLTPHREREFRHWACVLGEPRECP